jgi:hypothetical protein
MICPQCGSANVWSRILWARPGKSFDYRTRTGWHLARCRACPCCWVAGMARRGRILHGTMQVPPKKEHVRVADSSEH